MSKYDQEKEEYLHWKLESNVHISLFQLSLLRLFQAPGDFSLRMFIHKESNTQAWLCLGKRAMK